MSRRSISTFLVATLIVGCGTDVAHREPAHRALAQSVEDNPSGAFTAQLRLLHAEFVDLRVTAYRQRMFKLLRQLRQQSVAAIESHLYLALAEAEANADGLEPLIVAQYDALGRLGDGGTRERVSAAMMATRLRWKYARPFGGMLVPVSRADTVVIVNMRADAMRDVMETISDHPDRMALEEVLGLDDVRADACGLASFTVMPTALDQQSLDADANREEQCLKGTMKAGSVGNAFALANGGCLDVSLDAFQINDEYTVEERNADMEACFEALAPDGGGSPIAGLGGAASSLGMFGFKLEANLGPAIAAAVQGIFDLVKMVGGFFQAVVTQALANYYQTKAEERRNEREDRKTAIDAEVEAVQAFVDYAVAEQATKDAAGAVDNAEDVYADADRAYNGVLAQHGRGEVTQQQLDDAKKRRDDAKAALDAAKKAHEEAKRKEAEAKAEAAKKAAKALLKAKQAGDVLEPQGLDSPACMRLAANGHNINDPLDLKRLPGHWTDVLTLVDPRTINPSPDDPGAADALGLPACGGDPATLNQAALDCNSVVDCPDPSVQCSCNGEAIQAEAAMRSLLKGSLAAACVATECGPDELPVAVGQFCVCQPGEEGDEPPGIPPLPLSEAALENIFLVPPSDHTINGLTQPLSVLVREALTRDRGGRP